MNTARKQFLQAPAPETLELAAVIRQFLAEGFTQKELQDKLAATKFQIVNAIDRAKKRTGARTTTHWVVMGIKTGEVR